MKDVRLFAYDPASVSAKDLSKALGIKRIKHQGSQFKGAKRKLVINWGSSKASQDVLLCSCLNHPYMVKKVVNKLSFFQHFDGKFNHPEWTQDKAVVRRWLANGVVVFARTLLDGNGGKGIVEITMTDDELHHPRVLEFIPDAPLYTAYIPKAAEYRVHVIDGEVVSISQKVFKKMDDGLEPNFRVRTHHNGFIFVRTLNDRPVLETCPDDVKEQALKAVAEAGLDFGGVDVIWNNKQKKAYVLEINTAPGIEGTTLAIYAEKLKTLVLKKLAGQGVI